MSHGIIPNKLIGALAALISIGAGLYLLSFESAAQQTNVFDMLTHGIGAYCIARGVWMIAELAGK
jgi:hypothetical protein